MTGARYSRILGQPGRKHFRITAVALYVLQRDRSLFPAGDAQIWSDQRKFEIWLEIEVLACEAMAELGQIPKKDAAEIRKRARFSIPEILEIEKRTNHDVIAFLENVAESVGPAARWIHQGLTSSDILDTTLAVQLTESSAILLDDSKRTTRRRSRSRRGDTK